MLLGLTISPATAEAATVAEDAMYILASLEPILPLKFLVVDVMAVSPSARRPMWPPMHDPQVGLVTIPPAFTIVGM